jgi:predicted ester cyclase
MPDLAVALDEAAVVRSQVWAGLRFSATHRRELLGQPGTSRRVSYVGQAVHDVRDGRLSRVWVVADTLSLYRQVVAEAAPGT